VQKISHIVYINGSERLAEASDGLRTANKFAIYSTIIKYKRKRRLRNESPFTI